MSAVHFHLALTHLPIYGTLIGTLIFLYGMIKKNSTVTAIAQVIFIAMAVVTIPIFLTGEGAEESVEEMISGGHKVIHDHEEVAETAMWVMYLLGLLSIANLFRTRRTKEMNKTMNAINLLVAAVTCVIFFIVGNLGGQIRHTEIRNGNTTEMTNGHDQDENEDEEDEDEGEDHDDDHEHGED